MNRSKSSLYNALLEKKGALQDCGCPPLKNGDITGTSADCKVKGF